MTELAIEQKSRQKRKKSPRKLNGCRQPILPTAIYDRPAAAKIVGCSILTLIRAYNAGYLGHYTAGRYIKHSGQHLLDWLESGGKTGWGRRPAEEGNGS